jgi:hypothetical protein
MAISSTPPISLSNVGTELGRGAPISMNDADVRALAGKPSGAYSMSDFLGKSSFAVDFSIGAQQDVTAGSPSSGNRRIYKLLSSSVTGGSGSYTYSWSASGYSYSNLLTTTSASAQLTQSYNINDFDGPYGDVGTVTLTVTDTSNSKVISVSKTVGLG